MPPCARRHPGYLLPAEFAACVRQGGKLTEHMLDDHELRCEPFVVALLLRSLPFIISHRL